MDVFGGSAVWGDAPSLSNQASSSIGGGITSTASTLLAPKDDPFDEFDEFGDSAQPSAVVDAGDDDFGDFGDFTDDAVAPIGQEGGGFVQESFSFGEEATFDSFKPEVPQPLRLDPMPDPTGLTEQVGNLLSDILKGSTVEKILTGDGIRQIDSSTQLLVTPDSRSLYKTLFEEQAPSLRAPNWTRSKIRRNHLITLGIPVNLDEVNPQATGRALPTLNIITRPASTPPRPGSRQGSRPASRVGTPTQGPTSSRYNSAAKTAILNLGPKPELDHDRVERLLNLDPENLPLLSIPKLEAHASAIRSQTIAATNLLTYLLQCRDALQQDSDAFNKMIAGMVNEAQRMKSGMKKPPPKRGSALT